MPGQKEGPIPPFNFSDVSLMTKVDASLSNKPATPKSARCSPIHVDFFVPSGLIHEALPVLDDDDDRCDEDAITADDDDLSVEFKVTLTRAMSYDVSEGAKGVRSMLERLVKTKIAQRELGVLFENLRVVGAGAAKSPQPTFGSMFDPRNILGAIRNIRHPPLQDILRGFEGAVRPGEMLLVLGRPGSGCSTFLKVLANHREEYHAIEGTVSYDSFTPEEVARHFRGDVQYCGEDDVHFPTLTVAQTLSFATKSRMPQSRPLPSRAAYVRTVTEAIMSTLGLAGVKNTLIGNDMIRGISGGEKKRVSIGETLATRHCIGVWDNSTRGLDSSTALEFVQALRTATDLTRTSTIVSLYQAGEPLYKLFDKVAVIYEGRMAYFGPAREALGHFVDLGYEPAHRQTTADFLVAATDPNARNVRPGARNVPRTADEFAHRFKESWAGQLNKKDIASFRAQFVGKPLKRAAFQAAVRAERARFMNKSSPYTISIFMQARAVMLRRFHILKGDKATILATILSCLIQAIIIGTVFLKIPKTTAGYYSRASLIFYAVTFPTLIWVSEIPSMFGQSAIVRRHKHAALYHPFIEAIAASVLDIPPTFVTLVVFSAAMYFIVGLQSTAFQFFIFFLTVLLSSLVVKTAIRMAATVGKTEASTNALVGIPILIMVMYTGFVIPDPAMVKPLRWLTFINPLRYAFEVIMTNEFRTLNGTCATLAPQGSAYANVSLNNQVCTAVGSVPGQPLVEGQRYLKMAYGYSYSHLGRDLGIIIAFGLFFFVALIISTEVTTTLSGEHSVVLYKRSSMIDMDRRADDEERVTDSGLPRAGVHMEEELSPRGESTVFLWQSIRYIVELPDGEHRQLLDDISGYVAPGKLTALMGESGAGKTTLLNILADRFNTGVFSGDRFVNGHPLPADFQAQTGYVQQMDIHLGTVSVREAMLFSAKMRQPVSVSLAEKEEYVEECLKMCALEEYADAIVGSLSTELRKRTTIGVELAAKPKLLLFLDEPTSGLDSQSAWAIIMVLRKLARSGQAIMCTIHQPSAELFQAFDKLLLLQKGGKTVYFGDIGNNAGQVIQYFEENGARPCQSLENPAEYMLDVIGAGATAVTTVDWHAVWKSSREAMMLENDIYMINERGRTRPAVKTRLQGIFATPWTYQVMQLLKREAQCHWRDPSYLRAKMSVNVLSGLFVGISLFQSPNTLQGTQNKLMAIYLQQILSFTLVNQLQVPFITTRNVYEGREGPSLMYSWTALVTSQMIVAMLWNIFGALMMFLVWYGTVGFPLCQASYALFLSGIIFPVYYTSFGHATAAISPDARTANLLFSLMQSFHMIFGGILQPFSQLRWWKWMYFITPFRYYTDGMLGQALGHQLITCSPVELVTLTPPNNTTCGAYMEPFISASGGYLTNPDDHTRCEYCPFRTADHFLKFTFNISYDSRWVDVGVLLGFCAFNIVCLYALMFLRIRRRNIRRQ